MILKYGFIILSVLTILTLSKNSLEHFDSNPNKIDTVKAKKLIDEKRALLIDIRSREEQKMGYHPVALFVEHDQIRRDHPNLRNVSLYTPLITHCVSGRRAKIAAKKLKKVGFKNVFYVTSDYKSLL